MKQFSKLGLLLAVSIGFCFPARAHHSTTGFDLIHGTIVSGVVTRFDWENPHAHLYLNVAGEADAEHWTIELESPAVLSKLGWNKEALKPGDRVTVTGSRAKDASFRMRAGFVLWPDGRKLATLPTES